MIPGGAYSGEELKSAMVTDPVVREHFSDFHTKAARTLTLPKAEKAYVSYRIKNKVYWTSKQVTLPAGEKLLTDGAQSARARCGNRVSETPKEPTSANEPPAESLEMAEDPPNVSAPGPEETQLSKLPPTSINQQKKKKVGGWF